VLVGYGADDGGGGVRRSERAPQVRLLQIARPEPGANLFLLFFQVKNRRRRPPKTGANAVQRRRPRQF
jgi:hypothetical protein